MLTLELNLILMLDCKFTLSKYGINNAGICRPRCLCSWQQTLYIMHHTFFSF